MKKPAKPARTAPVTPSMKNTAMLVPKAIGESLWPKHTGQARAARGAATIARVMSIWRIFLHPPRLSLKCSRVYSERGGACERRGAGPEIHGIVAHLILSHGPRGEKGREHDRQRNEQQMKGSERHQRPPV